MLVMWTESGVKFSVDFHTEFTLFYCLRSANYLPVENKIFTGSQTY
jgi:hypothetical protein